MAQLPQARELGGLVEIAGRFKPLWPLGICSTFVKGHEG
jgi:hypothetical protein